MQCKREQMGKSYVGKGFGGPQRREIWLLNVSHTNLQLPPALPHDTPCMEPAHGAWRSRLTAGRECNERTVAYLCFLENTNKEQSSSTANKGEINPEASRKTVSCTPSFQMLTENQLYPAFISSDASAFFTVTLSFTLSRNVLPPERLVHTHGVAFQQVFVCAYMACMHSLNISRARQLIWFQLAGLSGTSCDSSGSYLLSLGSIIYKTANMTYCWGCLYPGNIYT